MLKHPEKFLKLQELIASFRMLLPPLPDGLPSDEKIENH